jgi:plastocyanin
MKISPSKRRGIATSAIVAIIGMIAIVAATGYYLLNYMSYVNNQTFNQVVTTTFYEINQVNVGPTSTTTEYVTTTVLGNSQVVSISIVNGSGSQRLSFEPGAFTVVIGVNNTVKWTNNDTAVHTVTSQTVPAGASSFDSGSMPAGSVFTYTFTVPGVYTYYCRYHSWMVANLTVLA